MCTKQCSVTCGDGRQSRKVTCSADDSVSCDTASKPSDSRLCSMGPCPQSAALNRGTFEMLCVGDGLRK